jgi:hypothetical protein
VISGCLSILSMIFIGITKQILNRIKKRLDTRKRRFLSCAIPPFVAGLVIGAFNYAMPLTVGNGNLMLPLIIKYGYQGTLSTHQLLTAGFSRILLLGMNFKHVRSLYPIADAVVSECRIVNEFVRICWWLHLPYNHDCGHRWRGLLPAVFISPLRIVHWLLLGRCAQWYLPHALHAVLSVYFLLLLWNLPNGSHPDRHHHVVHRRVWVRTVRGDAGAGKETGTGSRRRRSGAFRRAWC